MTSSCRRQSRSSRRRLARSTLPTRSSSSIGTTKAGGGRTPRALAAYVEETRAEIPGDIETIVPPRARTDATSAEAASRMAWRAIMND